MRRGGDFQTRRRMLSKFMGPRYVQLLRNWVPTMTMWGSVGAVGLVWATDWRLILDYVPYINDHTALVQSISSLEHLVCEFLKRPDIDT